MVWNPSRYLQFGAERLRPALDLIARIPQVAPGFFFDLGCGPGNVTALLRERWPDCRLTGVDASPEMLARSRADYPGIAWQQADIGTWCPGSPADLIFSNAALHWLPDHPTLLPRLVDMLAPGGTLALQMPANFAAPSHAEIRTLAAEPPWHERLAGASMGSVLDPRAYYDLLAPRCRWVDLWETTYWQVLQGDDPVVDWVRGTTLTPYLERLGDPEREAFLADYRQRIAAAYPRRVDEMTLFPFRRLFIVAGV